MPSWEAPIKEELVAVEETISYSVKSSQPILTEISLHVIASGGKRLRPAITILSFRAAGGESAEDVVNLAAAFELIHSASLLHDDINDRGEMRRGREAAYKKYGVERALVTGDFLFVQGFRLGGFLEKDVVNHIADACTAMAESEILQANYEHKVDTPIDVYRTIIEGKTAKPIEAGARVGAFLAGASVETIGALGAFGLDLGIAFQIVDDVLDVVGDESKLGKAHGLDILEGKPTLPLLLAMEDPEHGPRIRELFSRTTNTKEDVKEALGLILETNAVEESMRHARGIAEEAREYLEIVDESIYKDALLELTDFVVNRNL